MRHMLLDDEGSEFVGLSLEVELDAVGCNGTLVNYAIAEHVENAGVHSGDATLLLPAQKLFVETHRFALCSLTNCQSASCTLN
eukprot:3496364-Amphidinium_carterae.2